MMKTLDIDIETAPIIAFTWGLWDQNISLPQIIDDPRILCLAAKWRHEKQTQFFSEWTHGRQGMLEAAHGLLTEADSIVHYNGERFDTRWMNGEFLRVGLTRPAPFKQIDLMKTAKKQFLFPSYKLEYILRAMGLEGKAKHEGFPLWVKCLQGDASAQRRMEKYCKQDVKVLQPAHDRLMSWITNQPNARLYNDGVGCPSCGPLGDLVKEGFSYTTVGKFQRYSCKACGSWSTDSKRIDATTIKAAG